MTNVGDKIQLTNQEVEVEKCRECENLMVNLDADQLAKGDLTTLKKAGVLISNPSTDKAVCINCEYQTLGKKVSDFFASDSSNENDDDSSFFHPSSGGFLGGSSFGGFGGFGGGSFGGGGASRSF